jgi:uncharacterized protein YbjT (DUF2867 family)
LANDAVDLVALTRRSATSDTPGGVKSVTIDFDSKESLENSLRGVERLFIAHGTSPQQVAHEIALIDAAVAVGVSHIVKLSVMGPPTRLNPYAWHMEIEAHLARQPIASTVLRPSAFMEVLERFAKQISTGTWAGAAGNGRVNWIDTRDVAKVARFALLEPYEAESQRVYHLTGTRSWSMQQLAEALSHLLSHPVLYSQRTPQEHRAALLAQGASPFITDLLIGLDQIFRDSVHGETTMTVRDLTGEAPTDLQDWLTENIDLFRATPLTETR